MQSEAIWTAKSTNSADGNNGTEWLEKMYTMESERKVLKRILSGKGKDINTSKAHM